MNIVEICNALFANRKLHAKRKSWDNKMIAIYKIGWASQYKITEPISENPQDYYIQHIKDNRLIDEGFLRLSDMVSEDWEIINP